MIKRQRVIPFQVSLMCDVCGHEMVITNTVLLTNPQQYSYRCMNPHCSHMVYLREAYPRILYEPEPTELTDAQAQQFIDNSKD